MSTKINELADAVEYRGMSRSGIRRIFGEETYRAVCDLIQARRDAATAPEQTDEELPPVFFCEDCGQIEVEADGDRCERCQRRHVALTWIDATEAECRELCERHGWDMESTGGGFNTMSRYYTISRMVETDEYGMEAADSFKLRISDHGSCYCSEDISLAMSPSGDDHTMETFTRRLSR